VRRLALETPAVPQPLQPATWAEVASPPAARPTALAARPTAVGTSAAGAAPAFPAAAHTPAATPLPAPSACMAASARDSAATAAAGADGTTSPTSLSAPLFVDLLRAARAAEPWLAGWTLRSTGATLQLVALSSGGAGQPSVVRLILELDPDGAWVVHALRRRGLRWELLLAASSHVVFLWIALFSLCKGTTAAAATPIAWATAVCRLAGAPPWPSRFNIVLVVLAGARAGTNALASVAAGCCQNHAAGAGRTAALPWQR